MGRQLIIAIAPPATVPTMYFDVVKWRRQQYHNKTVVYGRIACTTNNNKKNKDAIRIGRQGFRIDGIIDILYKQHIKDETQINKKKLKQQKQTLQRTISTRRKRDSIEVVCPYFIVDNNVSPTPIIIEQSPPKRSKLNNHPTNKQYDTPRESNECGTCNSGDKPLDTPLGVHTTTGGNVVSAATTSKKS